MINGPDIFPIEIKAGMTITREYFKGLNHFTKTFPESVHNGSGLVCGGVAKQKRTDVSIVPFKYLNDLFTLA